MEIEFEVKILEINEDEIVKKLADIGAKSLGEKFQKRLVYDFDPKENNKWIRLRNNGEKSTLTVKEIEHDGIDGTFELEIDVGDFEKTNQILEKLGYFHRNYQENIRKSFILDGVEIEIDTWPKIPTYIEIEGKSIDDVKRVVRLLGFEMAQTTSKSLDKIAREKYNLEINSFKEFKF